MSGIIEQFIIVMTTSTGFSQVTGGMVVMWAVCAVLFYMAIVKQYEPLLLLPIAFGALLANIPTMGVLNEPYIDNLVNVPGGCSTTFPKAFISSYFHRSSFWASER